MGNELRKIPGLNQEGNNKEGLTSASPGFTVCPQKEKCQEETLGPSPPPLPSFGQICQEQKLVKPLKYPNLCKTRPTKDPNTWFPTFPCFAEPQADNLQELSPAAFPGDQDSSGAGDVKPANPQLMCSFSPVSVGFLWWRTETEEP